MLITQTAQLVTETTKEVTGLLSQINWAQPSWDLLIFFLFATLVIFYGFSLGKSRIIIILLSIYMALAVANTLPYLSRGILQYAPINPNLEKFFAFPVIVFLIIFVVLLFLRRG